MWSTKMEEAEQYAVSMAREFGSLKVCTLCSVDGRVKLCLPMLTQSLLPRSIGDTSFFYALEMADGNCGRAYNRGISRLRPNRQSQVSKLACSMQRAAGHLGLPDPVFEKMQGGNALPERHSSAEDYRANSAHTAILTQPPASHTGLVCLGDNCCYWECPCFCQPNFNSKLENKNKENG